MKKYKTVIIVAIISLALVWSLGSRADVEEWEDIDIDVQPAGPVDVSFSQSDQAPEEGFKLMAGDPDQLIAFFPQDTGTTTTVLCLTNILNVGVAGQLAVYRLDGSYVASWSFTIASGDMVRICADQITSGVTTAGWNQAWFWNFGPDAAYAKMIVPHGVVFDGYVVWNEGTRYNPNMTAHTLPLRFTTFTIAQ